MYSLILQTRAAQQLWEGREASERVRFIPGVVAFDRGLKRLLSASERDIESNQAFEHAMAQRIVDVTKTINDWQNTIARNAPSNTSSVAYQSDQEIGVPVAFSNVLSRRIALLVGEFDQAVALCLVVASICEDLDVPMNPAARVQIREHQRLVRSLLYFDPTKN